MGSTAHVLLLDDRFDPASTGGPGDEHAAVICLFHLDPVLRQRLAETCPCHGLDAVVGSEASWGEATYALTDRFATAGPKWRCPDEAKEEGGAEPWRLYLVEALYRELHSYQLLLALARFGETLRGRLAVDRLVFEGNFAAPDHRLFEGILESYPALEFRPAAARFTKEQQPTSPTSGPARLRHRLRGVLTTRATLSELASLAEGLDRRYTWRCRLGPLLRLLPRPLFDHRPAPEGAVVLLSTYRHNTANLKAHMAPLRKVADALAAPLQWLLTNVSAAVGLPPGERRRSWLWAEAATLPREPLESTASVAALDGETPGWSTWRDHSPTLASWLADQQYLARDLTRCFEAFLARTRPRLLVVANQYSLDGWLARVARRHGVPVVQVMHGVLGGHLYTRTPIATDLLVTYGDFWRRLWPEEEHSKIVVCSPEGRQHGTTEARSSPPRRPSSGPRRLTFFSWDLEPLWGHAAADFRRRLGKLFHRMLSHGVGGDEGPPIELTVRCHPLEDPAGFVDDWRHRFGPLPTNLRVEKGGPLGPTLDRTDVALMFRSTLMLDCLTRGIPVVMPGWIDFVFNRELANIPGIHLATDSSDLADRLDAWLVDPPVLDRRASEDLVASAGHGIEDFERRLRTMLLQNPGEEG